METEGQSKRPEKEFVSSLLTKWRGGKAKFWEYRATLNTFKLRVFFGFAPVCLEVSFSGTNSIEGPVFWENAVLHLEIDGNEYVISDKVWGFKVRAMGVTATEIAC